MTKLTLSDLQKLPKVELHGHIDGYLSPQDILRIAKKHKRQIVTPDGGVLRTKNQLIDFWKGNGYDTFLSQILSRLYPVTRLMQSEETIKDAALAYVERLSAERITYAEGRFAPQYHTREGLTMSEAVDSMLQGLKQGEEIHGVKTNLIVCIGREVTSEVGQEIARVALDFAGRGVVALDLACDEKDFPPERHLPAFQMTFDSNLRRTVHAGEGCLDREQNLRNIRTAVELLRADGLGHAIHLPHSDSLLHEVQRKGIRVESNPVSNVRLGYISSVRELQIDRLLREEVLISINSDDPAVWNQGSLAENLYAVAEAYDFVIDDVKKLILNGVRSAFISDKEKGQFAEAFSGC